MKSLCWGIIFLSTFVFAGDLASDYKEFEKKISEEKELQFFSFFEMPNLIVGSGIKSKLSCDEIRKNEKKQRGEPVKVKDNLISKYLKDSDIDKLKKCNSESCVSKIHTSSELSVLVKSKDIKAAFDELIRKRINLFRDERKLKGYEKREDNAAEFKKTWGTLSFLKWHFPEAFGEMLSGFWKHGNPATRQDSIHEKWIDLSGPRTQKVYQVYHLEEFSVSSVGVLVVEVPIYSDHYFDSSFRVIEYLKRPNINGCEIVLIDVLEIDELKKSAFIRMLFTREMEKGVRSMQKKYLNSIGLI